MGSLRPAFARIYPAGRSDLGAETFFHTQRGSPLLEGLTDDDLITWFGKTGAGRHTHMFLKLWITLTEFRLPLHERHAKKILKHPFTIF